MPTPTRSIALALALLLFGSQLAAAQHGIDHLVAPPDHACTQCLHQPGQKHSLPGWKPAATAGAPLAADFSDVAPAQSDARSSSCQSRAPPAPR
jgi:hypothetical protein